MPRTIVSRDVIFKENSFLESNKIGDEKGKSREAIQKQLVHDAAKVGLDATNDSQDAASSSHDAASGSHDLDAAAYDSPMDIAAGQRSAGSRSSSSDNFQTSEDDDSSSFDGNQHSDSAGSSSSGGIPSIDRYNVARDRQRKVVRPPSRYGCSDLVAYALSSALEVAGEEPLSYEEAVRSKDSNKWLAAMESEIESLTIKLGPWLIDP